MNDLLRRSRDFMLPTFIVGTLSQIAQLGLFFGAAAALVVGMLGLR